MANEYLLQLEAQHASEGFGAVDRPDLAENPYLADLQNQEKGQVAKFRASTSLAVDANPDQVAQHKRIAETLGAPLPAVEAIPDQAERAVKLKKIEADTANAPALRRKYTDADFARLAHDDSGPLAAIESSLSYLSTIHGRGLLPDISAAIWGKAAGYSGTIRGAFEGAATLIDPLVGTILPANPFGLVGERFGQAAKNAQETAKGVSPPGEGVVAGGISSGVQSFTQNLIDMPMLLLNPAVGMGSMVSTVGGNAYQDAREAGVGIGQSLTYGTAQAAVEYATEKLPVSFLLKDLKAGAPLYKMLLKQVASEIPGEQAATVLQDLNEWAVLHPDKPFSSYLEERPSAAAQTLIATLIGVGGNVAVVHGVDRVVSRMRGQEMRARNAEESAAQLEQLVKVASASKLLERDPATFAQFIEEATAGGPIEHVFIDPTVLVNTLNQSGVTQDQLPPSLVAQIQEAQQTGADVRIPTSEFATALATQPFGPTLIDNLRTSEDAMTRAEAKVFMQSEGAKQVQQEVERVLAERAGDETFKASRDTVRDQFLEQLNAAKRFTPEVNTAYATMLGNFYAVAAAKMGMTPGDLVKQYQLNITAEAPQGGRVMDQMKPRTEAFRSWMNGSKVSSPVYHATVNDFDVFDTSKSDLGAHFGSVSAANKVAASRLSGRGDAKILPVWLSLKNPLRLKDTGTFHADGIAVQLEKKGLLPKGEGKRIEREIDADWKLREKYNPMLRDIIRNAGYDGVVYKNEHEGGGDSFIAFDPTQIKSVFNDGSFDPNNPNILEQGAKRGEQAPGKTVPTDVDAVANVESAFEFAATRSFPNNREFKIAIQDRVIAAAKAAKVKLDEFTQGTEKYLVRMALADGITALRTNPNAVGWYNEKVSKALAVVSLVHPEITTDPKAKFAFVWAMAVTSNGLKVDKNFEIAEMVYSRFKVDGKMPGDAGIGTAAAAINRSLLLYNTLIEKHGFDAVEKFMTTMQTVKDVEAFTGNPVSGENLTTRVYGAAALGPKIGNGFFMNLYGHFEQLTMDRWLMRTWGRWTGTLVETNPEQVKAKRTTLKAMIQSLTAEQKKQFESIIKRKLTVGDVDAVAVAIFKVSQKPENRVAMSKVAPVDTAGTARLVEILGAGNKSTNRVSFGDELRKAGNALTKYLDGQKETPAGPPERGHIRKVFGQVMDELTKTYPALTMSDYQALLWYPEKRLYDAAKTSEEATDGYEDDEAPDYANAAVKLARKKGIPEADIQRTLDDVDQRIRSDVGAAGTRPSNRGLGDGQAGVLNQSAPDSDAFEAFTEGLDVIEDTDHYDGGPAVFVAYHGTTHPDISVFKEQGNVEGFLGAGPYFTTSAEDASANYAGVGPDLTGRIEKEAETILQGMLDDDYVAQEILRDYYDANPAIPPPDGWEDNNISEALDEHGDGASRFAAKQQLKGATDGLMMKVFVKLKNPADTTDARNTPDLTYETTEDENGDIVDESGTLIDWIEAARTVGDNYGMDFSDYIDAVLSEGDGVSMAQVFRLALSKLGENVYDDNGNMLSGGAVFREIAKEAGYDGVIMDADEHLGTGKRGFGGARIPGMAGVNPGTLHIVPFVSSNIKSATGNRGTFDPNDPNILNQGETPRGQISLGADITKSTSIITLLKGADLSTFIHESGHFFLEVQADLAAKIQARVAAGEDVGTGAMSILEDMNRLLTWFGVEGSPEMTPLQEWISMDLEQKRSMHEKFARGFEAYAFEGRAPSLELTGVFQRFRSWMLNVYKQLLAAAKGNVGEALNVQLTDEVRSVMDRMLATTEQIQEAEAARAMGPLYSPENSKDLIEGWEAYHELGVGATQTAIDELQARGLKDMQWLQNARSRKLKELQKQHDTRRREVMMEVRADVMAQPIYRAWTFLTGKVPKVSGAPTAEQEAYAAAIDEWRANRDAADTAARADAKVAAWEASSLSKEPQQNGLVKGQFLARNKKDIDLVVQKAMLDWTRANPQPARPDGVVEETIDTQNYGKLALDAVPKELVQVLKALKMTAKEGGMHPDLVAEMFGFSSGDELMKALAEATPPKEEIEGLTDSEMLGRYGEMATPEGIERATDQAIHNDVRAKFVASELRALARSMGVREPTGQKNAKGQDITIDGLAKAAKAYAAQVVARLRVRDIKPAKYSAAEVRAAKAAATAMAKGKTEDAAAAKRTQLINLYATKAAYQAQEEVEKAVAHMRSLLKRPAGVDGDYLDQIEQLLERFDLAPSTSLKALDKRTTLSAWVETQREQGLEPDIPPELLNEAARTSWKNMTVEELRGLRDAVAQIGHLGRLKNRLLTAQDQREFAAAVSTIVTSITDNAGNRQADVETPNTVLGAKLVALKRFWASHIKAATWARVMDGGKDGGPVWEYLIRSANVAGDAEVEARAKATKDLAEILAPVLAMGKMGGKGTFFPTIGRSINREARLAIALNMGNDGNLQRLLDGRGWTMEKLQPVLDTITQEEWDAVQKIWDYFETFRPAIGAKEKRVYGKEPVWIEPTEVVTKFGTYRGGYYPLKYDPRASERAESHAEAEDAKRAMQGAYTSATTRRSFTKTRVEEVAGRPLLLSIDGIYNGVQEVIHDLSWHEWLIDANRLIRNKAISGAMREHYGPEAHQQFKMWLADVAMGERGAQNAGEAYAAWVRQGVSIGGLGWNVMSALTQPLGLTQSIVRIGPKWVARGIVRAIGSPLSTADEINEKSTFMRTRAMTRFREIAEVRSQVKGQGKILRAVDGSAYYLMMRAQQLVDVPTWWGAYEKAIGEGNNERRAVALADQAVIDAQGSGSVKDLSAIERGSAWSKLFTTFYSFFNTALNLGVGRTMTEKSKARIAADYLLLFVAPTILLTAMKDALTPGGDDDWEEFMRKLIGEEISYLMGMVVGVREFGGAVQDATGTQQYGSDYSGPAGLRMVGDAYKLGTQIRQGEMDDGLRKAIISLAGDLARLPAAQINRSITGFEALRSGETENPLALIFGVQR